MVLTASRPTVDEAVRWREDFPILRQEINRRPLVYLDSAATTQKPQCVIDALVEYYTQDNANVHRGVHQLSERATRKFEAARTKVRQFLGAADDREIIFTRGCTESINLVASSLGPMIVGGGDEILITGMEHHSNIVPWQILAEKAGGKLVVVPITDAGEIRLEDVEARLSPRTKIVSVTHISNALGTINPIKTMTDLAHRVGAIMVVDGAQSVPHLPVNVREIGCDFFALSGHKMYGPTGIGVLYGKRDWLEKMPPYQSGGDMIKSVTFEKTIYNDLPYKFEAGTPHIAGAIGLAAAIGYLQSVGLDRIAEHESDLLEHAAHELQSVPDLRLIGPTQSRAGLVSFLVGDIHPHDLGTILDEEGVAIRTGHHCAQPVMDRLGIPATCRASFGLYNTAADIATLVAALHKARAVFA